MSVRSSFRFVLLAALAAASACKDCGHEGAASIETAPLGPAPGALGAAGVRVVVQIRDFVAYSQLATKPPDITGDMVVMDVLEAPGLERSLDFDVIHRGAAPADPIWRDVGARYEITLHRGFVTNAQEPPRPDQILGPIELVAKPDPNAVPRHPSLEPGYECPHGADDIDFEPLAAVTGPAFAAVVIPAAAAQTAHSRCEQMQDAPFSASGFWSPSEADVRALERKLPDALRAQAAPPRPHAWQDPGAFARQYVGYESQGKRLVHVSLIPWWRSNGWRCQVIDLCPQGRRFFALELDPTSQALVRFVADPP